MKAYVISDRDYDTEVFKQLNHLVIRHLRERNIEITERRLGREELAYCMGCFGCWTKKPGECVINDGMTEINRETISSDAVIYLTPIVYGQFSANIKNAVDRFLPNMLPFFEIRPNGSTMHPGRYTSYPKMIMIGYGDNISEKDGRLFNDITKKHRRNIDVLIYSGNDAAISGELQSIDFNRVGGQL